MDAWSKIVKQVADIIDKLDKKDCDIPFFRGHSNSSWKLLPSLFRKRYYESYENVLYEDFVSYSGSLLPRDLSSWEILFEMRQRGIPTRILDWTENFGVALYFALKERKGTPCIWILDPFSLNQNVLKRNEILNPNDLDFDYKSVFVTEKQEGNENPIAIYPVKQNPRILAQKVVFTLHGKKRYPIEKFCPEFLTKIEIPNNAIPQAERFLTLAGINEFSLFPDLDGLSRYLIERHK